MKAWDYEGVDLFAADGSGHIGAYCNADFKKLYPNIDIESDQVSPIFATDEADFYPSCEVCGGVFDYINLTEEGEAYEEEMREPDPEDYVLSDSGYLGSKTSVSVVDGTFMGEFDSEDAALDAIGEQMERDRFYPGVWKLSDHGNYTQLER